MKHEDLYVLTPINGNAAKVTKQPRHDSTSDLRAEWDALKKHLTIIEEKRRSGKLSKQEECDIKLTISKYNRRIFKIKSILGEKKCYRGLESILIDVIKERIPEFKFNEYMSIAKKIHRDIYE